MNIYEKSDNLGLLLGCGVLMDKKSGHHQLLSAKMWRLELSTFQDQIRQKAPNQERSRDLQSRKVIQLTGLSLLDHLGDQTLLKRFAFEYSSFQ